MISYNKVNSCTIYITYLRSGEGERSVGVSRLRGLLPDGDNGEEQNLGVRSPPGKSSLLGARLFSLVPPDDKLNCLFM